MYEFGTCEIPPYQICVIIACCDILVNLKLKLKTQAKAEAKQRKAK